MKKLIAATLLLSCVPCALSQPWVLPSGDTVTIEYLSDGALRLSTGPNPYADKYFYQQRPAVVTPSDPRISAVYDPATAVVSFPEIGVSCSLGEGEAVFTTPADEHQYGTGQYQDGYLDIKGLSRRLTQVNTQIAVPMIISNKGYGILWNNCGITELNPGHAVYTMVRDDGDGETVSVDATGTSGNVREQRHYQAFTADIDIPADGEYSLLLDVGQQMARKHYLAVDGEVLTEANNVWLPPTTSVKTRLSAGRHHVEVRGEQNDRPTLYVHTVGETPTTTLRSEGGHTDFTIFAGSADSIIADMRRLTGHVPMPPKWAFGYVHCRERYTSQDDILANATRFRHEGIPLDVIVQDWQWWGDNGWNAMKFDQKNYPDPKALTDSLHAMDVRMMLSVWAKVDKNSELGREIDAAGHYIPGTDWIDFFSDEAAEHYWQAYRDALVPTGIDSWWQDATEPENDDLHGRVVGAGQIQGDDVRNVFPIVVNDRVYRGLRQERPDTRPLILTRSGAPGLQRYSAFTWSGDVGNDWQTLRRQIIGGLGQMSTGLPWWTYDAGGFFRPGDQYTDSLYQQRMTTWIGNSVFLPMMRVHGYMSRTEPWHYMPEYKADFENAISMRYRLLPYVYSEAAKVSLQDGTLMRPMVFDFPDDEQALAAETQYMLGQNMLVCPKTSYADNIDVYLPQVPGGWYDIYLFRHFDPGHHSLDNSDNMPWAFVRAGSITPVSTHQPQSSADVTASDDLVLIIMPGADGAYSLYDDDGVSMAYADGCFSLIPISWDDAERTLTIGESQGDYSGFKRKILISPVVAGYSSKAVEYNGKEIKIQL